MKPELGKMVTKEEALDKLFQLWSPAAETERVPLEQAAGRVLLGVHWLRDVLAGLAFGWLCGLIGFWLI